MFDVQDQNSKYEIKLRCTRSKSMYEIKFDVRD